MKKILSVFIFLFCFSSSVSAQIDEDKFGAWYMYFWNTKFSESKFGFQGDIQYRNWNLIGDLEQLLLRGGMTYSPGPEVRFTVGYGNITSGEFGNGTGTSGESRIYQEALLPHKLSDWILLTHRFRYEQRWVENQDFRTRYRYNLFINVPLNQPGLKKNSIYLAFYNELFINGERKISDGRRVELFDRNRLYSGVGYGVSDKIRVQIGFLVQTTDSYSKEQLQVSMHHSF